MNYFTFLISCLLISITPGVNALNVIRNTLNYGKKYGFKALGGQLLSLMIQVLIIIFSISLISDSFLHFIKIAGGVYFIYLGLNIFLSIKKKKEKINLKETEQKTFLNGFLVNSLNPKALLFQISFVPQFVNFSTNNNETIIFSIFLILTMFLIEFLVMTFYIFAASWSIQILNKESTQKTFDFLSAFVFILLGIVFLY